MVVVAVETEDTPDLVVRMEVPKSSGTMMAVHAAFVQSLASKLE